MKSLKLDHDLAKLVVQGKKTSTWRLFDDKDISVNDTIELLDKVDPNKPQTWKVIGMARINEVIQKRLGDIKPKDFEGHEVFGSHDEMLKVYRKFYGNNVSDSTPVKIIHFSFVPANKKEADTVVEGTTDIKEAKLYTDGGSRGNPGPSASGFAIMDMNNNVVVKKGIYLGVTTNNQAEYQSLKFGLEEAERLRVRIIHVFMDSQLVINQLTGKYKIRNRDLWPIHAAIKEISKGFKKITLTHVPRELNKIADHAVNEALDKALLNQR